jgi:hypothetical protein
MVSPPSDDCDTIECGGTGVVEASDDIGDGPPARCC